MIRATYYLGATIVVEAEDHDKLDDLADAVLAVADAALADVARDGAYLVLVGPPYVEDVDEVTP
jgi:hypothetical protein